MLVEGSRDRGRVLGVEAEPLVLEAGQGLADRLGLALAAAAVDHQPGPGVRALAEGVRSRPGTASSSRRRRSSGFPGSPGWSGCDPVQVVQRAAAAAVICACSCAVITGAGMKSRRVSRHWCPALPGRPVRHRPRQERTQAGQAAWPGSAAPAVTARPPRGAPAGWCGAAGRPGEPGGAGRCGTACSRRRRRSASRASRAWAPAPASARGRRPRAACPPAPAAAGGAVPVAGGLVALGGLAGAALLLLLAHLGRPLRDRDQAAEQLQQHGQQLGVGLGRQPACTGLAQQVLGGLVGERGDLALGRQPVPAQRRAIRTGRRGPGRTPAAGRGGRARMTHLPLCCPPRSDGFPW